MILGPGNGNRVAIREKGKKRKEKKEETEKRRKKEKKGGGKRSKRLRSYRSCMHQEPVCLAVCLTPSSSSFGQEEGGAYSVHTLMCYIDIIF